MHQYNAFAGCLKGHLPDPYLTQSIDLGQPAEGFLLCIITIKTVGRGAKYFITGDGNLQGIIIRKMLPPCANGWEFLSMQIAGMQYKAQNDQKSGSHTVKISKKEAERCAGCENQRNMATGLKG